jgi:hypothetical protein
VVLPYLTTFSRHCEERSDEAIQLFACCPGLLRFARNDGEAVDCTMKELSDYGSFMRRHAMVRRIVLAKD